MLHEWQHKVIFILEHLIHAIDATIWRHRTRMTSMSMTSYLRHCFIARRTFILMHDYTTTFLRVLDVFHNHRQSTIIDTFTKKCIYIALDAEKETCFGFFWFFITSNYIFATLLLGSLHHTVKHLFFAWPYFRELMTLDLFTRLYFRDFHFLYYNTYMRNIGVVFIFVCHWSREFTRK